MGKYGTNLEGFGAFEGGVNADKGAPLVSTSSDGETALLFGPAALREIQAGVANGDFAIPPDAAGDTITAENPLPYWTFTDTDSAGAITCAIVADAGSGSGNILRWTVASGTTTGKTATLSRYVAVPATRDRAYGFFAELTAGGATNTTNRQIVLRSQYHKQDLTTTGSEFTSTYALSTFASTVSVPFTAPNGTPADAAFLKLSIQVDTTGTNASATTVDVYEVKTVIANPYVLANSNLGGIPGAMWKVGTDLYIANTLGSFDAASGNLLPTAAYLLIGSSDAIFYDGSFSIENGQLGVAVATASTDALLLAVTGDTESRLIIDGDGTHNWGSGSAAQDTNLYRSAANTLKTDDSLVIGGSNSNWVSRITATAAQSLTNNTLTKITFNTASSTPTTDSYDPQGWFDNANDRIVIGQDGFYNITANVGFAANATSRRLVQIFVNGSDRGSVQVTASAAGSTLLSVSTNIYLVATDYVEVHALQQSGGALNTASVTGVYPVLSVARLGA